MQLKDKPSLRLALAAASCALLADHPVDASESNNWIIDAGVLYYDEKDRVSIIEPVVIGTLKYNDEDYVSVRVVNDTMTGASPTGASVSNEEQNIPAQTSTSASGSAGGNTHINVKPNELPLSDFSDERNSIAVDWQKAYSRNFRTILGGSFSDENDYRSFGSSINFQRDTADKLTTFTLGLALSLDLVGGRSEVPEPLVVLVNQDVVNSDDDDDDHDDDNDDDHDDIPREKKWLTDVIVGVTQVVSRRILTQLNYGLGRSTGYLSDPYKMLSRVNSSSGKTIDYLSERRPDSRIRQTIFWKTVFHLPSDVIHLTYRYYWDDWSISSHTAEIKYRFNAGNHLYFMPNFRYYKQSGAEFFKYSLLNDAALPNYASADLRLAPMQSTTTGMKVGYDFSQDMTASLRVEYMQQWGEDTPSEAVGLQRQLTLFPKLEVMMYTFSFSMSF